MLSYCFKPSLTDNSIWEELILQSTRQRENIKYNYFKQANTRITIS